MATLLILLGIGVRLHVFLGDRPLWADESALALSIATRSYSGLTRPLDYDQSAPLAYLFAVRAAVDLLGVSEQSLRAVAQASSWILLIALWRVGITALGRVGGLVALGLCVVAPTILYYANEVKPYASDAAIAALLLAVAQRFLATRRTRDLVLLGAVGAFGIWLAIPTVFLLGAIGFILLFRASAERDGRTLAAMVGLGVIWVGSFLAAYEVSYRGAAESQYMQQFWSQSFLSVRSVPDIVGSMKAIASVVWSSLIGPLSGMHGRTLGVLQLGFGAVVLALMHLGFGAIRVRNGRFHAWLFVAPALIALCASLLHLYPVASRLYLFLMPSCLVLVAGGLVRVSDAVPGRWRTTVLAAVACALPLAGASAQNRWASGSARWADTKKILRALSQQRHNDAVYIYSRGVTTYAFYTTDWKGTPDTYRLQRFHDLVGPGTSTFENALGGASFVNLDNDPLVLVGPTGCEVLGRPTGMQWRHRTGFTQPSPDSGWAEREAARLQNVGARGIWLVFIHSIDDANDILLKEIESSGGVKTSETTGHHAALYRYEWPIQAVRRHERAGC